MKHSTIHVTYAPAAKRVKALFSKGQRELFNRLFAGKLQRPVSHRCNFARYPRLLPLNAAQAKKNSSPKKKTLVPVTNKKKDVKFESLEESLIEKKIAHPQKTLNPERVQGLKLKEYLCAARMFKEFCHEIEVIQKFASKKYNVEVFDENLKKDDPDQKNMEQWQDFIKSKEERHFRIGRVIKYLSD
jgi:hypothetical protein